MSAASLLAAVVAPVERARASVGELARGSTAAEAAARAEGAWLGGVNPAGGAECTTTRAAAPGRRRRENGGEG